MNNIVNISLNLFESKDAKDVEFGRLMLAEAIVEEKDTEEGRNYQKILLDYARPLTFGIILDVLLKFGPKQIRKKVSKCIREYTNERTYSLYWAKSNNRRTIKKVIRKTSNTEHAVWLKLTEVLNM